MLCLIEVLIVLSGISAAQAGPMRRYTNTTTTSQSSHILSVGVAYSPAASIPALSLAPVQGITTLPFQLVAEAATESHIVCSPASASLDEALPTTTPTDVQSFKYQPLESSVSTTITQHQPASIPTSFWTFGDENKKSTVTLTSTSIVYEYASQAGQPADLQSSQQNVGPYLSGNATTTTCEDSMSQTSVFTLDPVPTTESTTMETTSALPSTTGQAAPTTTTQITETSSSTSSTIASSAAASSITKSSTTTSSTTDAASPKQTQPEATTSEFAYPYPDDSSPTTTNAIAQNDSINPSATSALPIFSHDASNDLPEVVIESTQSHKQKQYDDDLTTTSTALSSALPGITIVPAYPSVIYITVTDAGATTTVTG